MFGFDVKEVFKDRIYETIFVLSFLHLGVVMVSFLLKWIHPHIKNCSVMPNNYEKVDSDSRPTFLKSSQLQSIFNNLYTTEENKATHKNCSKSKTTISEEEGISIIKYLETYVDTSSIPQEFSKKRHNKGNVPNELSLEINKSTNFRKLIKDNLNKFKCSSEAQTNISFDPTFQTDCSLPKFIFTCQSKSCDVPLHINESSDSFESVCSIHSDTEESKLMPVNHSFKVCDINNHGKSKRFCKVETVKSKHDAYLDIYSLTSNRKVLKTHLEYLKAESHNSYEKQVSQENKILEKAINEFEDELKPIKSQIKVLKECLLSFDYCETDNSSISDASSSVSEPITQSESYSEKMSTTCTSDLKSFSSKCYKMLDKNCRPLNADMRLSSGGQTFDDNISLPSKYKNTTSKRYKTIQSFDKYPSKCPNKICILEVGQSANTDPSNLKKRSPIADMYIKLSQCSSQAANFVKNHNYKLLQSSDKSVTCHINLNISLGNVTMSSTSINDWIKEREMLPVLSEPEDAW